MDPIKQAKRAIVAESDSTKMKTPSDMVASAESLEFHGIAVSAFEGRYPVADSNKS